MAPLEDDLNAEQKLHLALAKQDDLQERELLKIKTNAAILAAPVAFLIAWMVLDAFHVVARPEDYIITIINPIITTAIINLSSNVMCARRASKRKAQQEKS